MVAKNIWFGMLVLSIGLISIGNLNAQTDNRLNGSWVQITEGIEFELRLRNGNFEELYNGISFRRGTFTTSAKELTITPTNIHGGGFNNFMMSTTGIDFGLESRWYSFNEAIITIRTTLLRYGLSEREANEFVQYATSGDDTTSTYSVDGNTLILVSTMQGQSFKIILTKK